MKEKLKGRKKRGRKRKKETIAKRAHDLAQIICFDLLIAISIVVIEAFLDAVTLFLSQRHCP